MDFEDEQRACIRTILATAGVTSPEAVQKLAAGVASSISAFAAECAASGSDLTFRETHDRLRDLWLLAERPDPPIGQIRSRLNALPGDLLRPIERRAEQFWPIMFDEPAPTEGGPGWLVKAPPDKLAAILVRSISDGRELVFGRGRGGGRRSRAHFEPRILGVARGEAPPELVVDPSSPFLIASKSTAAANGRPRDDGALQLIGWLAVDWAQATGEMPTKGRSDEKPFGNLVHQAFGWIGRRDATGALRRYWREQERRLERDARRQSDESH